MNRKIAWHRDMVSPPIERGISQAMGLPRCWRHNYDFHVAFLNTYYRYMHSHTMPFLPFHMTFVTFLFVPPLEWPPPLGAVRFLDSFLSGEASMGMAWSAPDPSPESRASAARTCSGFEADRVRSSASLRCSPSLWLHAAVIR
jgi:hypothetical protein